MVMIVQKAAKATSHSDTLEQVVSRNIPCYTNTAAKLFRLFRRVCLVGDKLKTQIRAVKTQ